MLDKFTDAVLGGEVAEAEEEQVTTRKNGTAKVVFRSSAKEYIILMKIYLYTDDPTLDLNSFKAKFLQGIRSNLGIVKVKEGRFAGFTFNFVEGINIVIFNSIEEALENAKLDEPYSNFFYVYNDDAEHYGKKVSTAYGGNSGILFYGAEVVKLAHELVHVLGYLNKTQNPNDPNSDWSHSDNELSIIFGRPADNGKIYLYDGKKEVVNELSRLNFGEWCYRCFIGMPRANAIYDKTSFPHKDPPGGVKWVAQPIYWSLDCFETRYNYDFFGKSSYPKDCLE